MFTVTRPVLVFASSHLAAVWHSVHRSSPLVSVQETRPLEGELEIKAWHPPGTWPGLSISAVHIWFYSYMNSFLMCMKNELQIGVKSYKRIDTCILMYLPLHLSISQINEQHCVHIADNKPTNVLSFS